MGYKCGNCGIDFPNKKQIVEHMIDVHNSPFVEGDESMINMSKKHINKDNAKVSKFSELYEGNDDDVKKVV